MLKGLPLAFVLVVACTRSAAMGPSQADSLDMAPIGFGLDAPSHSNQALQVGPENHRGVAIALAVLLGPFGAHRLYLGTTPKVAIAYGLTFGGFGVVALIDLVHLIVVKDLNRFHDSDRILMWADGDGSVQEP
ncbi:MAG TPA: TM2 domain-containing protein [Flavobacteriales bacterium]|nr:TM2 domain-containing protein [Flavobacteriales bacterium]